MIAVKGAIPDDLLALMQREDATLRARTAPAGPVQQEPAADASARTGLTTDVTARIACAGCFFAPECAGSCAAVPG